MDWSDGSLDARWYQRETIACFNRFMPLVEKRSALRETSPNNEAIPRHNPRSSAALVG